MTKGHATIGHQPGRCGTSQARDPETSPAAFLGRELQRARIAAGFKSQDALAVRLGFDRTVITKAESGFAPAV